MLEAPMEIALARYGAVSQVTANVAMGITSSRAIRLVAKTQIVHLSGKPMRLSVRTLQRWVVAYQSGGIDALRPVSRRSLTASKVLPGDFIKFLIATKKQDPDASIAEVIRRAEHHGLVTRGMFIRTKIRQLLCTRSAHRAVQRTLAKRHQVNPGADFA